MKRNSIFFLVLALAILFVTGCYQDIKNEVPAYIMQRVYEKVKTPYNYGPVLVPENAAENFGNPVVFRHKEQWYMRYIVFDTQGYSEVGLAKSNDLLHWTNLGCIAPFIKDFYVDKKSEYLAFHDNRWGGSYEAKKMDNICRVELLEENTKSDEEKQGCLQSIANKPVIQKMGKLWVTFNFGEGNFGEGKEEHRKETFNRFACSYDLENWTEWAGEEILPTDQPHNIPYAHKSFVLQHDSVVYHFYNKVDAHGHSGIAVATSKDAGKSFLHFNDILDPAKNTPKSKPRAATPPPDYTGLLDVTYTKVGDWEGKLDLYLPPKTTAATPLVIHIHGGGFTHGNKESQWDFEPFFEMGFAVANLSYRLAKVAPAPASIEDVCAAIAFLTRNAYEFNIDTAKMIARGSSAGGYLALMAGLTSDKFAPNGHCADHGAKLAAIVAVSAPTYFSRWKDILLAAKYPHSWLNGRTDRAFVEFLSPVNYVTAGSPPVFMAHGDRDDIVPCEQSQILYTQLKKNSVKCEFLRIQRGIHGLGAQRKKVNSEMMEFIKVVLMQ